MTGALLRAIGAKGNGFVIGEMTGPGCERWHVFIWIRFRTQVGGG